MNTGSLRLRLFIASALSVSIALILAFWGGLGGQLFASHVERRAIDELSVQLDQILVGIERDAAGQIIMGGAVPADARFTTPPFGGLYWQIETEGQQLRSRSLWDFALDLPPDHLKDGGAVHVHYLPGPGSDLLLVMERSVQLPSRLGGVFQCVPQSEWMRQTLKKAPNSFGTIFCLTLLCWRCSLSGGRVSPRSFLACVRWPRLGGALKGSGPVTPAVWEKTSRRKSARLQARWMPFWPNARATLNKPGIGRGGIWRMV